MNEASFDWDIFWIVVGFGLAASVLLSFILDYPKKVPPPSPSLPMPNEKPELMLTAEEREFALTHLRAVETAIIAATTAFVMHPTMNWRQGPRLLNEIQKAIQDIVNAKHKT